MLEDDSVMIAQTKKQGDKPHDKKVLEEQQEVQQIRQEVPLETPRINPEGEKNTRNGVIML